MRVVAVIVYHTALIRELSSQSIGNVSDTSQEPAGMGW